MLHNLTNENYTLADLRQGLEFSFPLSEHLQVTPFLESEYPSSTLFFSVRAEEMVIM